MSKITGNATVYYGPESQGFERSGNFKFYAPYGVITSKGAVLNKL